MARKNVILGVMDEINPVNIIEIFPKGGFHEDVLNLRVVNFGTVWKYMIEASNAKRQLSAPKPLVIGFNFFKSDNVMKIRACSQGNKLF